MSEIDVSAVPQHGHAPPTTTPVQPWRKPNRSLMELVLNLGLRSREEIVIESWHLCPEKILEVTIPSRASFSLVVVARNRIRFYRLLFVAPRLSGLICSLLFF